MDAYEASKLVEKQHPRFKVLSVIDFDRYYVMDMVDKKTNIMPIMNGTFAVDKRSNHVILFSPTLIKFNHMDFMDAKRDNRIWLDSEDDK